MAGAPYILIALLFGLATGFVGRGKGSSFFIWFLIGTVLPLFGLIAAILYRSEHDEPERRCPTLQQHREAAHPGLPALRDRPLPAGSGRGQARSGQRWRGCAQRNPFHLSQVRTIAFVKPRP